MDNFDKGYEDLEDIVGLTVIDIKPCKYSLYLYLVLMNNIGKLLFLAYKSDWGIGLKGREKIIGCKVSDIFDDYYTDDDYDLIKYTIIYSGNESCTIFGKLKLVEINRDFHFEKQSDCAVEEG